MFVRKKVSQVQSESPIPPEKHGHAGHTEPSKAEQFKEFLRRFGKLVLLTWLVILLKDGVEKTHAGEVFIEKLRQSTYSLLIRRLGWTSKSTEPIRIVNVNGMLHPNNERTGNLPALDRKQLLRLLTRIAEQRPAAIGVDYNFAREKNPDFAAKHGSAEATRYVTKDDEWFFRQVEALQSKTKIYLGVFPREGTETFPYYMNPRADNMAAAILVPRGEESEGEVHTAPHETETHKSEAHGTETASKPEDEKHEPPTVTRMPLWYWNPEDKAEPVEQTMASALAQTTIQRSAQFEPPHFLKWGLTYHFDETPSSALSVRSVLVDYSICRMLKHNAIGWESVLYAPVNARPFENKIVLVGDATPGHTSSTSDSFFIPGASQPTPGIYLHACAIKTILDAPLYALTVRLTLLIDILLAGVVFFLAPFLERELHRFQPLLEKRNWRSHFSEPIVELGAVFIVVALALAIGVGFVTYTRAMWDDLIVVILCLFIHWGLTSFPVHGHEQAHPHHESHATHNSTASHEVEAADELDGSREAEADDEVQVADELETLPEVVSAESEASTEVDTTSEPILVPVVELPSEKALHAKRPARPMRTGARKKSPRDAFLRRRALRLQQKRRLKRRRLARKLGF